MDESSSKQQIRESTDYTLIVRKTGALGLVLLGLTAGRQAGEWGAGGQAGGQAGRQADKIILALKIFKIL